MELRLRKFKIPTDAHSLNLQTLDFPNVEFQDDYSLQSNYHLFNFPFLEVFLLSSCKW